ncbi:MAG: hypothetical protein EA401_03115 [Planctomycetota bacterium]|nr:MAG: hypothetical protein EA401_03115 [Planctomycetota bacterium]
MAIGLRIEDAPRLQTLLAADQRLLLRVGALLQNKWACSAMVLESVGEVDGLRALLMDRQLADCSVEAAEALIEQHCGANSGLQAIHEDSSWCSVVFSDEVNNPLMAAAAALAKDGSDPDTPSQSNSGLPQVENLLPDLAPTVRPVVEALLAANSDEQRAAAVEQLRYVTPPHALLEALMPLFLGDGAQLVRDAARRLLKHRGTRPVVIRIVDALHDGDQRELDNCLHDLGDLPTHDAQLLIAALTSAVDLEVGSSAILAIAEALAKDLVISPQLPRFFELALGKASGLSLLGLTRNLQELDLARMQEVLYSLLGRGREQDTRLIGLIVGPGDHLNDALLQQALDLLLSSGPEPLERMGLAAALGRAGNAETIVAAFLTRVPELERLRDSAALWLIGEWTRQGRYAPDQAEVLLPAIISLYEQGSGPQVNTMLEQRLPASLPLPQARRGDAIVPLGELAARTRAPRNRDLITAIIRQLCPGHPDPCWQLIEEHPHSAPRLSALLALPHALAEADHLQIHEAIQRLLTLLARDLGHTPSRQEQERIEQGLVMHCAARLSQLPGCDNGHDDYTTISKAAEALGPYGWPALGLLVAGPYCPPQQRSALINRFLNEVEHEISDAHTKQIATHGDDNPTFIFDRSLASHTHFMPDVLEALERIARSPHTPAPLLRHIIDRLSEHFLAVAEWKVIWAPGNILQLAGLLSRLASNPTFPQHLRRRVVKALTTRVSQPEMAGHLARVLSADSDGELAAQAAQAAHTIISLHADDRYLDDERSELAAAVIDFLHIPDFGDDDTLIRQRLAVLLSNIRRHIREHLRQRLQALVESDRGKDLRKRLRWALPTHDV